MNEDQELYLADEDTPPQDIDRAKEWLKEAEEKYKREIEEWEKTQS